MSRFAAAIDRSPAQPAAPVMAAAAILAATVTADARADLLEGLYAVDNIGRRLIRIDAATGAGTAIGETGLFAFAGLAHDPGSGQTYLAGFPSSGTEYVLYTIDLESASVTSVGGFGPTGSLSGLSRDGLGNLHVVQNVAFGIGEDGDTYRVDPASGAAVQYGNLGADAFIHDAALDPVSGEVWAAASDGDFYTLDTTTGAATYQFSVDPTGNGFSAIAFSPAGVLYAVGLESGIDRLFEIDRDAKSATAIGSTGFDQVSAMTFAPAPGTLMIIALMTVGARRRRQ